LFLQGQTAPKKVQLLSILKKKEDFTFESVLSSHYKLDMLKEAMPAAFISTSLTKPKGMIQP